MTCDNAMTYLDAGASHVIVTSYVFRDGRLEEDRLKALVSGAHNMDCCFLFVGRHQLLPS